MMSARLWRSSPRKTPVGSPATPSAWMAAPSSELGASDESETDKIRAPDRSGFRLGWAGPCRALQRAAKTRKAAGRLLSAQNRLRTFFGRPWVDRGMLGSLAG